MHSRPASNDFRGANGERIASGDPWQNGQNGWDIADQLAKMKLNPNGNDNDEFRTPPNRATVASVMLDASPLDTHSDASSRSPDPSDAALQLGVHSRGSSVDTTGSRESMTNHTLHVPPAAPKPVSLTEHRERPHSYSGGFAPADLKRLRTAGESASPGSGESTPLSQKPPVQPWASPNPADQPSYPSLAMSPAARGPPQHQGPAYAPMPPAFNPTGQDANPEYQPIQRQYSPAPQAGRHSSSPSLGGGPFTGRPHSSSVSSVSSYNAGVSRAFSPPLQGLLPNTPGFPYGGPPQPPLSLGGAQQQMHDMMHSHAHENPAVARIQQQHGAYRPTHQYSTSDPSSLRDAAALTLALQAQQQAAAGLGALPSLAALGAMGGVPGFAGAGGYVPPPALSMYANGFYGTPQDVYAQAAQAAQADLAQAMAVRLQQQYGAQPYPVGMPTPPSIAMGGPPGITAAQHQSLQNAMNASGAGNGPSANNRKLGLYKTELCRSWEEKGTCRYGTKCQFAHGEGELRIVSRHPKYKTEICRTFWVSGSCPYGKRCCFIHTELPASGAPPGADGTPPPAMSEHDHSRSRSASTNSDPSEASSLLARINAQRHSAGTPTSDVTPTASSFQLGNGPRPGGLRVDTSTLPGGAAAAAAKENKSAYPTFQNGMMHSGAVEQPSALSPMAVTAHPDFGSRGGQSRLDMGTQPQSRLSKTVTTQNNRHSFNGTDIQLDFNNPPASLAGLAGGLPPQNTTSLGRAGGHMRSGSAGNWSTLSRPSRLGAPNSYSPIPGGDLKANSPWGAPELVGSARLS